MAAASENDCLNDPNFAVICNFLDRYGEMIGLGDISYTDLQTWLEDTKHGAWNWALFYNYLMQNKLSLFIFCYDVVGRSLYISDSSIVV